MGPGTRPQGASRASGCPPAGRAAAGTSDPGQAAPPQPRPGCAAGRSFPVAPAAAGIALPPPPRCDSPGKGRAPPPRSGGGAGRGGALGALTSAPRASHRTPPGPRCHLPLPTSPRFRPLPGEAAGPSVKAPLLVAKGGSKTQTPRPKGERPEGPQGSLRLCLRGVQTLPYRRTLPHLPPLPPSGPPRSPSVSLRAPAPGALHWPLPSGVSAHLASRGRTAPAPPHPADRTAEAAARRVGT